MRTSFLLFLLFVACGGSTSGDAGSLPEQDAGVVVVDAGDDAGVDDAGTDAGVDAGTDAGLATSSQGSGKLPCTRTGSVNTTAGAKSYCVATIGNIEVKVIEPDDLLTNRAPLRLALYLHGDGARTYLNDTAPRFHAPWTTSHHVLYVVALAPNSCAWWTKPTVNPCDAGVTLGDRDLAGLNARALEDVITAVRAGWDVANEQVLYGGASGGSIFLSADFLPRFGAAHPGRWALSCGGEVPWTPIAGDASTSDLWFTWGDQDFLAPDITTAVAWFGDAGFPVETKVVAGAQHCAFDHLGRTVEIWSAP